MGKCVHGAVINAPVDHVFRYQITDGPSPISKDDLAFYYGTVTVLPVTDQNASYVSWITHFESKNDAGAQAHVVEKAGLRVARVDLMHLNREHRHPSEGPLFIRADVSVSPLRPCGEPNCAVLDVMSRDSQRRQGL